MIVIAFKIVYISQSRVTRHGTEVSTVMSALVFAICFIISGLAWAKR
jgi:hypothetical protein